MPPSSCELRPSAKSLHAPYIALIPTLRAGSMLTSNKHKMCRPPTGTLTQKEYQNVCF